MIVVTPRAEEACLPRAFVKHWSIFEAFFLWKDATAGVLSLMHKVEVIALVSHTESFVFSCALLRRPEI